MTTFSLIVNARHHKFYCCCSIVRKKEMIERLFAVLLLIDQMTLDVSLIFTVFLWFNQTVLLFHENLIYHVLSWLACARMMNANNKKIKNKKRERKKKKQKNFALLLHTRIWRVLNLRFFSSSSASSSHLISLLLSKRR